MSQTSEAMATATTIAIPHTKTIVDSAVTTVSTIITSSLVKVISNQAEPTNTTAHHHSPEAASTASAPSPFIREPYASAFNFFGSVTGIFYCFVVTIPAAIAGIIAICTWRRRCREEAAAKRQQDIERAETRTFQHQLVQEARLQRECLEKIATKMIAGGLETGVNEALVTVVETMKEARKEGMRKRRVKKVKKNKDRPHPSLLPDFPAKNNAPAWGSTSTTELESLLDTNALVEGKEDDDYEADKEESVYDEDDCRSTVSTTSSPQYLPGEWEKAEKQSFLVMEGEWDWKPVKGVDEWW